MTSLFWFQENIYEYLHYISFLMNETNKFSYEAKNRDFFLLIRKMKISKYLTKQAIILLNGYAGTGDGVRLGRTDWNNHASSNLAIHIHPKLTNR